MPLAGIQSGTSASDSGIGNRGVKRKKEETDIEDGQVDAHLGVPVPPPKAPMAQPSRPGIMTSRWLTKIIGGQEYIIIDDDGDEPDTMVHEAPPIEVAPNFAPKTRKSKPRRPRNTVSRPGNIKREPMEVDPPLPSHDIEIDTSDWEDEVIVEHELQVDEVEDEYDELLSSEDEDDDSSHSEASTVGIPEPGQSTMVGRMRA